MRLKDHPVNPNFDLDFHRISSISLSGRNPQGNDEEIKK
jgi:hypothetical protein